jgi:hypothetical protein
MKIIASHFHPALIFGFFLIKQKEQNILINIDGYFLDKK